MTALSLDRPRTLAAVELCLLAILLVQATRLLWGLVAPVDASPLPFDGAQGMPAAAGATATADPFFPDGAQATAAAASDWTLHGLRRAQDDAESTAILSQAGSPQAAHRVGDTIAPGVVLQAVGSDHVLLLRDNATLRIDLPAPTDASQAAAPAAALPASLPPPATVPATAPGASTPIDPQRLFQAARLRAHREDGRLAGFTVMPGNDDALLRQAGLQPGDVLLDVNGQALDPARLLQLADELSSSGQAQLTFRRDGQTHTLQLGGQAP